MRMKLYILLISVLAASGCKKQDEWLEAKRQQSDVVPKTLADFQAILDNTVVMNTTFPIIGQVGTDNYYFPDEEIGSVRGVEFNSYTWAKDIFEDAFPTDYQVGYLMVNTANIVLEGLSGMKPPAADQGQYNSIRGQALFFRSIAFYELAAIFCKPYEKSSADTDLGICLRTSSNIHEVVNRSSVAETYRRVIDDLQSSVALLPAEQLHKTRPSKIAAFALLARTYLLMGEYDDAKAYADSVLNHTDALLNFNSDSVSLSKPYRFPAYGEGNREIIFYAYGLGKSGFIPSETFSKGFVDSNLYRSYDASDLRKIYFFQESSPGAAKFRGTYAGTGRNFTGIAVNEIYFIRMECNARLNNVPDALLDLNTILRKRYREGTYIDFATTDKDTALLKILEERRKELPFTAQIRWQDLRRLNRDARFSKTLQRVINGVTYQLMPNDKRYVYPFPQSEVDLGIEQNER